MAIGMGYVVGDKIAVFSKRRPRVGKVSKITPSGQITVVFNSGEPLRFGPRGKLLGGGDWTSVHIDEQSVMEGRLARENAFHDKKEAALDHWAQLRNVIEELRKIKPDRAGVAKQLRRIADEIEKEA